MVFLFETWGTCYDLIGREDADARDAGQKGSNHLLTVTVAGFRSEARCVPVVARTPPPSPDACFQALQTLPLGYYKTQFMGARDTPTRSLYTRLPRWFVQGMLSISAPRVVIFAKSFFPGNMQLTSWVFRCSACQSTRRGIVAIFVLRNFHRMAFRWRRGIISGSRVWMFLRRVSNKE